MYVSHLSCPKCNKTYESEALIQLCECGAPLLVEYNLEKVKAVFSKEMLKERAPNLWRYMELLPVKDPKNIINLGEGMTPLLHLKRLGKKSVSRIFTEKMRELFTLVHSRLEGRQWVFLGPKSWA